MSEGTADSHDVLAGRVVQGAAPAPSAGQRWLLLGAGSTHLAVMQRLQRKPLPGVALTWVTPQTTGLRCELLAGWVAGDVSTEVLQPPLEPLAQRAGAHLVVSPQCDINHAAQVLRLPGGSTLPFDVLSIDVDPKADRSAIEQSMPGAREHALWARPAAAFIALWPRLLQMCTEGPVHLAVVGHGLGALELALAAQAAFAGRHGSRVTLITQDHPAGAALGEPVAAWLHQHLRQRQITVLRTHCQSLRQGELQLGNGAQLVCDAALLVPEPDVSLPAAGRRSLLASWPEQGGAAAADALLGRVSALLADQPVGVLTPHSARWVLLGRGQALWVQGSRSWEGRLAWWWRKRQVLG
jgi:hypothetical protein